MFRSLSASELALFGKPARYTTASSRRQILSASSRKGYSQVMQSTARMPIPTAGVSCRDQNHCRALQFLLAGKLPRADRHHLGLRRQLNAVLPDGRAAALPSGLPIAQRHAARRSAGCCCTQGSLRRNQFVSQFHQLRACQHLPAARGRGHKDDWSWIIPLALLICLSFYATIY